MTGPARCLCFLALVAVGCGSSTSPSTPGTATFSGALTGSVSVLALGTYVSGDTAWGFAITNNTTAYPNLNFAGQFAGTSLQTGTYTTANSELVSTLVTSAAAGGQLWTQSFDATDVSAAQGSFQLVITAAGAAQSGTGNTGWNAAQGTATLTLVPESGNPSGSNTNVSVTF